jgi:hypothetical protein
LKGEEMNLVDKMRIHNQTHEAGFNQKQNKYIKSLFKEIEIGAKNGNHSVTTLQRPCFEDWFTYDFYKSIPEIFKSEGFIVEEESNRTGLLTSWWRISW